MSVHKKNFDVSVVILNYNTAGLTRICLETLLASELGGFQMEVIVCDNGSTDQSVQMIRSQFPSVTLIENQKNRGFAAGNNPGIRIARGRYVLLLNTDTEIPHTTIRTMIHFMDDYPDCGAATCKLLLPDGSMDPACHRGFPTPWASFSYIIGLEKLFPTSTLFSQYHQGYKNVNTIHEVDCIVGAFFMVRHSVIDQVGLLDEDYFMYGEDIDWAYRIKQKGWKILFNPEVTILHKKKQSGRAHISKNTRRISELYFHENNWLFYKKNYAKKYGYLLTFFVHALYATRIYLLKKFNI
jgi:GT2 family glycosyltransferase